MQGKDWLKNIEYTNENHCVILTDCYHRDDVDFRMLFEFFLHFGHMLYLATDLCFRHMGNPFCNQTLPFSDKT